VYEIVLSDLAEERLGGLPEHIASDILKKIYWLAENADVIRHERLKGHREYSLHCGKKFRENALLFLDHLRELSEGQRQRLAKFTVNRCYLVIVSTPDLDSAYRIFSVLNDRGLDLSHTDILKAEVIGKIPETQQEAYTKKWEDTEDALGREAFKDLFAHIRMIYRKAKLRGTVLKEFRQYVAPTLNRKSKSTSLLRRVSHPLR
jgi:hypothetical protein